jgi:hypothetical protein
MLSETQKQKIYNILAEVYVDLIKDNKIGKVEQRTFAEKVLKNIESAQSYEDVLQFIDKMVTIYPSLKIAQVRLRDNVNKIHEQAVMGQLQSYFKSATSHKASR